MGVVQARQGDFFAIDVLPHVQLGPVADREDAEMFARRQARVEQCPQLGTLRLGLPLAKAVAVGEDALLGAGLLLVAARTANQRVEAELLNGFEQRDRLVHIARFARVRQAHRAACHGVFDAAYDQLGAQLLGAKIAEVGHLWEVVAGVDHQQRVGDAARAECFFRALEHDQRILAAGKQQGGALEGSRHLAQDEDGFLFQRIQMLVAQVAEHIGFNTGVHLFFQYFQNWRAPSEGSRARAAPPRWLRPPPA
ncbi:hypothetical protein D3C72_1364950 [compost metagenome]